MANGLQEQQPEVIDQQSAVTQQPTQQPTQQTTQQPTVYQMFASLNPQQRLTFRAELQKRQQKADILRNSGSEKMLVYEKAVSDGKMTWSQVLDQSKTDISPISIEMDKIYFKKDKDGNRTATPESMYMFYQRNNNKSDWGDAEQKRFEARHNSLSTAQNARDVALGKLHKTEAANQKTLRLANNDFTEFRYVIDNSMSGLYDAGGKMKTKKEHAKDKEGKLRYEPSGIISGRGEAIMVEKPIRTTEEHELLTNARDAIKIETFKDIGITLEKSKTGEWVQRATPETRGTGNQRSVYTNIQIVAKFIPQDYLLEKVGFYVGVNDEFRPNPFDKQKDIKALREMFSEELRRKYMRAINHLPDLRTVPTEISQPQQQETDRQEQPQQAEIQTVSSAADYNNLPKGATYIDPNGKQRTKQ